MSVTVSKFANANAVVTTGWTNPTYAYADDTSFATAAAAASATVNSDYGFADFSTSDIPDGSTITSVTMSARVKCAATTTNVTHGIQGRVSGANSGSEATNTGNTSEATITATLSGVTLANLRAASTVLKARVRQSRIGTTSRTSSLDWVNITVVFQPYTNAAAVKAAGTGVAQWGGGGGPALVQHLGDVALAADLNTIVLTVSKTVTVGNTIVVGGAWNATDVVTTTCTDNLGNTYTRIEKTIAFHSTVLFVAPVTTGGSLTTVTIAIGGYATLRTIIAAEYSGVGAFSVAGAGSTGTGTTGTWVTNKTLPATGIAFGAISTYNAGVAQTAGSASGSPSTSITKEGWQTGQPAIGLYHAIAGGSQVTAFSGTTTFASSDWTAAGAVYSPSGGGGTGPAVKVKPTGLVASGTGGAASGAGSSGTGAFDGASFDPASFYVSEVGGGSAEASSLVASGTGGAYQPVISTTSHVSVGASTGYGSVTVPGGHPKLVTNASAAASTGTGVTAAAKVKPRPTVAAGTGAAGAATKTVKPRALVAAATDTGYWNNATTKVKSPATVAAGTGTGVTALGRPGGRAAAVKAAATGTGVLASTKVKPRPTAAAGTATGVAAAGRPGGRGVATVAAVTGTGVAATSKIKATTSAGAAPGAAHNATVNTSAIHQAPALIAAGTGAAGAVAHVRQALVAAGSGTTGSSPRLGVPASVAAATGAAASVAHVRQALASEATGAAADAVARVIGWTEVGPTASAGTGSAFRASLTAKVGTSAASGTGAGAGATTAVAATIRAAPGVGSALNPSINTVVSGNASVNALVASGSGDGRTAKIKGFAHALVAAGLAAAADPGIPPTPAPPKWAAPYEYVIELFDSSDTFGPNNKLGELWDMRNLGWSRYDRMPGRGFFTLYQDSPNLARIIPLITHVRVTRCAPAGNVEVFNGIVSDYNSTGDDVIFDIYDYVSLLSLSRSGYRTMYPTKLIGTEIVLPEWALAKGPTSNLVVNGSFESGWTGWDHPHSETIDATVAHDGTKSLKFTGALGYDYVSGSWSAVAGHTYTLSFWMLTSGATSTSGAGVVCEGAGGGGYLVTTTLPTSWTFYTTTWTQTTTNGRNVVLTNSYGGTSTGTIWIDDVQVLDSASSSPLAFVTTGTIENPLGSDNLTAITTNAQFGLMDQMRLALFYDLTEMGRANTTNQVTYEITRTAPFTFNFWKNKGSLVDTPLVLNGTVSEYQHAPNWAGLRNDLATLGTTVGGGATEVVKVDTDSSDVFGLRQGVFAIQTLAGASGTVETDQQQAVAARALKTAARGQGALWLTLVPGIIEPFTGWDICDTMPVEIVNGTDSLTGAWRVVGARAIVGEPGERSQILIAKVLT